MCCETSMLASVCVCVCVSCVDHFDADLYYWAWENNSEVKHGQDKKIMHGVASMCVPVS